MEEWRLAYTVTGKGINESIVMSQFKARTTEEASHFALMELQNFLRGAKGLSLKSALLTDGALIGFWPPARVSFSLNEEFRGRKILRARHPQSCFVKKEKNNYSQKVGLL